MRTRARRILIRSRLIPNRPIRRALVYLSLGVVSTYVVAGVATKLADRGGLKPNVRAVNSEDLMHARYRWPGFDRYDTRAVRYPRGSCFGPSIPTPPQAAFGRPFEPFPAWRTPITENDPARLRFLEERWLAAGFPFRCFAGRSSYWASSEEDALVLIDISTEDRLSFVAVSEGTLLVWWDHPGRRFFRLAMPINPQPAPLAMNSLLFAGFWALAIPFPFKLRRALRRRAGRCVRCKYDLTGIDADQPCPECGRVSCEP